MSRVPAVVIVVLFSLSALFPLMGVGAENNPPNADAGPDKYAGSGDTIFFDGSRSSDPDGDNLTYSWDFDDTNGIQEDATGILVSTVYYAVGTYTVTLSVSDGNMSDTDQVEVNIEEDHTNRAPTAAITEPSNFAIYNTTSPVTFDGSDSTDPDGDLLTYSWDFGDGEQGSGRVTTHKYAGSGIMNVGLTVSDGEFQSSDSVTILIEGSVSGPGIPGPPPPPSVDRPIAMANGPYNYMAWDEVYLDSSGSRGGHSLDYCWDLDQSDGIQTQTCFDEEATYNAWEANGWHDTAYGPYPIVYYPEPGNYTITLIVREGYGKPLTGQNRVYLYNYSTAQVNIVPHDTVKVDAGKDTDIESGKKTNLIGSVKIEPKYEDEAITKCEWDFESDDIVDYEIEFPRSENLKKASCTAIHTFILNQTTKYDMIYTVTLTGHADGWLHLFPTSNVSRELKVDYHTTGNDSVNKTIPAPPNQVPVVECGGPNKVTFVGEETSFTVVATDPDDDLIVNYEWDFDGNGQVDYSNPASGDTTYTYSSTGSFVAKVNVTDERGGVGYCSVNVTVKANRQPEALIDAPDEADAGEEVSFDGSESSDPDGPDEIVSYSWDFDATDGITSDATGKYATWVFTKGGTYTVTLTVKDKHGYENSATHDITINQDYDVSLDLSGSNTVEVKPGMSQTFNMKLTNTGNGDDCFDIEKSGTKSTWGEFSTNQICLGAEESRSFTLRVSVPSSAKASDSASISVEAVSQGSSSVSDELRVTVNTKQSHSVSVFMTQTSAVIKQGKFVKMSIKVTNQGNGEDSFKLSAGGSSSSWAKFSSGNVKLDPKESKDITVTFSVPSGGKATDHVITLTATSTGDSTAKASVIFTVTVKEGDNTGGVPGFEATGALIALSMAFVVIASRKRRA